MFKKVEFSDRFVWFCSLFVCFFARRLLIIGHAVNKC